MPTSAKELDAAVAGIDKLYLTSRLVLRPIEDTETDRIFIHQALQSDPLTMALSDPDLLRPQNTASTRNLVAELTRSLLAVMICLPGGTSTDEDQALKARQWAYVDQLAALAPRPQPIGYLFLNFGSGFDGAGRLYRHHHGTANLGICLAAPHRGKGYGAEAIDWAVDWAFRFARMHRVTLDAVEYNTRAVELYKRLGFQVDGRHRDAHYHDRKWYAVLSFSMLEDEWVELRRRGKEKEGVVSTTQG